MDSGTDAPQLAALAEAIASVNRAVDEAAALLSVLAPVAGGLPNLQRAIAEFCSSTTPAATTLIMVEQSSAPLPAADTATGDRPSGPGEPIATRAAPQSAGAVAPAPNASTAPAGVRTISVIVSRTDGPLDLVRVHGAMHGMAGVRGVTLASYTRDRAVLLLDTDLPSATLPLVEQLAAAFPEGVNGEWLSDTEFVAAIRVVANSTP